MPRKAPNHVQEMRVTFGNYERQFVTEIKEDIENTAKVAAVSAVAVPVVVGASAVAGLGLLGYGIYRGLSNFSFGLPDLPTTGDLFDWFFPPIDPELDTNHDLGQGGLLSATLYFWTGGLIGEDPKITRARKEAVKNGGGGGDF